MSLMERIWSGKTHPVPFRDKGAPGSPTSPVCDTQLLQATQSEQLRDGKSLPRCHFADTVFNDIGSELNPNQGDCARLRFLAAFHLQATPFALAEVDGVVEIELTVAAVTMLAQTLALCKRGDVHAQVRQLLTQKAAIACTF